MASGKCCLDLVSVRAWGWSSAPPRCLFGVVARLAESLAVLRAALAPRCPLDRMVQMPHGSVTPGRAAHLVAEPDEPSQRATEEPGSRVGSDQLPGARVAEEPPQPDALAPAARTGHELTPQLGRYRAEAVQV